MALRPVTDPFHNTFNVIDGDIETLEVRENNNKDKCLIWDIKKEDTCYTKFIFDKNSKTTTLCDISFYPSSETGKYLPRLTFRKTDNDGNEKEIDAKKVINIGFNDSKKALIFWKFISFLIKYKELVDTGDFEKSYKVAPKDAYWIEFESKPQKDKIEALKELIFKADLDENGIKSLVFENRKKHLKTFLHLLKNLIHKGQNSIELYQKHFELRGEEAVWHHFFKKHDWILGLNVDIKFIRDFFDEQKVGISDSQNRNSPQVDILGISDYTTLIELKHNNTKIFKAKKTSKSRTNTWDFTPDFIEGISQCLAQKTGLEKSADYKNYVNNGKRLDTTVHKTIDPNVIFIIGNRKAEFPHDSKDEHHVKSETLERFRRNNRNVDIITFDELFERAYHIVFSEKISQNWYENTDFKI